LEGDSRGPFHSIRPARMKETRRTFSFDSR